MELNRLKSQNITYFVFGANGRFGSSFGQLLMNTSFEVKRYGSKEFESGLLDIGKTVKHGGNCALIWCFGRGSSIEVQEEKYKEFKMLQRLNDAMSQMRNTPNLCHFIYLSTGGKMYGVNPGRVSEGSHISPVGSYGHEKKMCEDLIRDGISNFFRQTFIFRVANAYTLSLSNEKAQGFVENCLHTVRNNKSIILTVNTASRRQYASHIDYAKAIFSQIDFLDENLGVYTFNLGPNFSYDIAQIIAIFETHFKQKISCDNKVIKTLPVDSILLDSEHKMSINARIKWKSIEENLRLV